VGAGLARPPAGWSSAGEDVWGEAGGERFSGGRGWGLLALGRSVTQPERFWMAGPQRSRGRAGVQRRSVRSGTEAAPKRSQAGPADPLPLGLQVLSQPRAARRLFSASACSAEALR